MVYNNAMLNRRRRKQAQVMQQQVHLIEVLFDILKPYLKVYILKL